MNPHEKVFDFKVKVNYENGAVNVSVPHVVRHPIMHEPLMQQPRSINSPRHADHFLSGSHTPTNKHSESTLKFSSTSSDPEAIIDCVICEKQFCESQF